MERSLPRQVRVSGYSGFVPCIQSQNIHGVSFMDAQKELMKASRNIARNIPSRNIYLAEQAVATTSGEKIAVQSRKASPNLELRMTGYGGFIPGIDTGHVYGKSFWPAQQLARSTVNSWSERMEKEAASLDVPATVAEHDETRNSRARSPLRKELHMAGYSGFIPQHKIGPTVGKGFLDAQDVANGVRRSHQHAGAGIASQSSLGGSHEKQTSGLNVHADIEDLRRVPRTSPAIYPHSYISGYSGFVPHVYSRNIHGATFQEVQRRATSQ